MTENKLNAGSLRLHAELSPLTRLPQRQGQDEFCVIGVLDWLPSFTDTKTDTVSSLLLPDDGFRPMFVEKMRW